MKCSGKTFPSTAFLLHCSLSSQRRIRVTYSHQREKVESSVKLTRPLIYECIPSPIVIQFFFPLSAGIRSHLPESIDDEIGSNRQTEVGLKRSPTAKKPKSKFILFLFMVWLFIASVYIAEVVSRKKRILPRPSSCRPHHPLGLKVHYLPCLLVLEHLFFVMPSDS